MLFSEKDIAVLRLLCWCQYMRPEDLMILSTQREINNLIYLGLVREHKKSGALVLSNKGSQFLSELSGGAVPQLTQSYHDDAIQRRLRLAALSITAYRASVNIFTTTPAELSSAPSLFLSAITRSRGSNPWGSTRIAAIAHLGDCLYAVHYVYLTVGKLSLTDELGAFMNQTAQFHNAKRAFLFAGESYRDILAELERPPLPSDSKLIRYGDAYRCLQFPVHLLPCDDTGAVQLMVMSVTGYREKVTRAALRDQYRPPLDGVPQWDAMFQGQPFVMAADMDLRRIDAAIHAAKERGFRQIAMAGLEKQAEAVLFPRYRDTGKARVFVLTSDALAAVIGGPPVPYQPPRTQFLTEKGDVIDAPPIQANRKAGG